MNVTRRELTLGLLAAGALSGQTPERPLPALRPKAGGTQFVVYADSTSGRPGYHNVLDLAGLNRLIQRLSPAPDFIVFPGDQIAGSEDLDQHRRQWKYFLDTEMAPIVATKIPVYHTTSNHDNFKPEHDQIFREALPDIPQNGPKDEKGLEYWIRQGDVLVVAVNMHSPRRGYGRFDPEWVDQALAQNRDATYKLVTAHLPVFSVNGYSFMDCDPDDGRRFWDVLVKHGVQMYLCSHVLAFDVQVHRGVVQLTTGCAVDKGLYPPHTEYVHFVQVALDRERFCFQTVDLAGTAREWGAWPVQEVPERYPLPADAPKLAEQLRAVTSSVNPGDQWYIIWRFSGVVPQPAEHAMTLLAGFMGIEVVFEEASMRLAVNVAPERDKSWEKWTGPRFEPGQKFSFELMMHSGLGPGGLMFRQTGEKDWNSMDTRSAQGFEQFRWPPTWYIGRGQDGVKHNTWPGELPVVEWTRLRTIPRYSVFGA